MLGGQQSGESQTGPPLGWQIATALSFVLACFASCLFTLGAAVRFAQLRSQVLDSLKGNAYGMYLIHYLFIVWLQFAMLGPSLPAVVKAAVVFAGTLALSWGATAALRQIPAVAQIIGDARRTPARAPASVGSHEIPSLSD